MTTPDLNRLRQAGDMRGKAAELVRASDAILAEEVPRAEAAGVSISEIARLGQVSRPTIYKLLRRR